MRILATTILLGTLTCSLTPALAANSQQDRMKACNATATQRELSGEARKTYMKECLSAAGKPDKTQNRQQTRMKECNTDATRQKLQGDARKGFIKKCLSGQAGHPAG